MYVRENITAFCFYAIKHKETSLINLYEDTHRVEGPECGLKDVLNIDTVGYVKDSCENFW